MITENYYFVHNTKLNEYAGLCMEDAIYDLPIGCIAYKLTNEQVDGLNAIVKKKIKKLTIIDKLKLLLGMYK